MKATRSLLWLVAIGLIAPAIYLYGPGSTGHALIGAAGGTAALACARRDGFWLRFVIGLVPVVPAVWISGQIGSWVEVGTPLEKIGSAFLVLAIGIAFSGVASRSSAAQVDRLKDRLLLTERGKSPEQDSALAAALATSKGSRPAGSEAVPLSDLAGAVCKVLLRQSTRSLSAQARQIRDREEWGEIAGAFIMTLGVLTIPSAFLIDGSKNSSWVISFLSSTAIIWLGLCLAASRKHLVLFLRRFEREDVARAVVEPVRDTLHENFRILTLQDSRLRPVRAPLASALVPALVACAPAAFVIVLTVVLAMTVWQQNPDYVDVIGYFNAFLLLLVVLITSSFAVLVVFGSFFWWFVSNVRARRSVDSGDELARICRSLLSLKRWYRRPVLMGPTAVTIRCDDSFWRRTVQDLAQICDLVVMDVSDLSPNVREELEMMVSMCPEKLVLTAHRPEFDQREFWQALLDDPVGVETVKNLEVGDPIEYDDSSDKLYRAGFAAVLENTASLCRSSSSGPYFG